MKVCSVCGEPVLIVEHPHAGRKTERAGSVADGNSNTPRGAVVESGVQPDAGEVDAEFESRPGPLAESHDHEDEVAGG